ncbi:CHAT domain-containing protein [bacterium]|nr:CHAT domain-containing protein [bacterium]
MKKQLVILKLDGDLREKGFRTTLSIGQESDRYIAMPTEAIGNLPAAPELAELLQEHWEEKYRNVGSPSRIKPKRIIYQGPISKRIAACKASAEQLEQQFVRWLEDEQFRESVNRLREELSRDDISRIIIRTGDRQIQKLPWHCWDFIRRYPKTEVAFSDLQTGRSPIQKSSKSQSGKVKVLAILGHSEGINIEADRQLLASLPEIETEFLPGPTREKLDEKLYEQAWDIIFFAGHSESEMDTGTLYINPHEAIEIKDIWHALRKAVERGLQLAIFNSCDGLGLVQRLDDVQIPHMIVMRELVPDLVAHKFLKHFLQEFPKSESFYVAVREARERLQGLEGEIPCASWLPVICENPALVPLTWEDLTGAQEEVPEPALTPLL